MRVLVVEDDAALGAYLRRGMEREGHAVEVVTDGREAVARCLESEPELMLLDLSLPRLDGTQVLEQLRGRMAGTSVLVLTGRAGLEDRVRCLNLGADDCLLKPFSFSELTARCRALERRRQQFTEVTLRHGGLELNRMERRVERDGRAVELTTKEYALLEYLMQARGRTCSRAELLREVWQMTPGAGTNVVDVYVNYLRKKLGNAEPGDAVIETVRGEGYALAGALGRKPVAAVPVASVPAAALQGGFGMGVQARA